MLPCKLSWWDSGLFLSGAAAEVQQPTQGRPELLQLLRQVALGKKK